MVLPSGRMGTIGSELREVLERFRHLTNNRELLEQTLKALQVNILKEQQLMSQIQDFSNQE